MKKTLTILMFIAIHGAVVAQEKVSVRLVDAKSLTGIAFAHILNQSTSSIATSNENGNFQITGNGSDSIKVSCLGYGIQTFLFSELQSKKEIELTANAEYLETVSVVAYESENVGVQRVDKLSLKMMPVNNAQDLLKTMSGVFIAQHAGGGKAEQIFLRGFDNDHGTDFAIFMDDVPINLSSHAHGQGYADMHFIIPELIEGADYYKGPFELENGNFSVSGAARYKSKNSLDKNSIQFDVGEYGYQRALVLLDLTPDNKLFTKNKYERSYLALEGTLNESFFDSNQEFEKFSGFYKYNAQFSEATSLVVSTSYFTSEWNASGQIPLRAVDTIGWFGAIDDTEGGSTARLNSSVKLLNFLNNNQKISNQIYYTNNQYQLFSNFTFFLNDSINGDMVEQVENRNILGYIFEYDREDKMGGTKLNTTFSMGFRSDWVQSELVSAVKRKRLKYVDKNNVVETNYWAYLKENWKLSEKWLVQFGTRLDYFNFDITNQLEGVQDGHGTGTRDAYRLSPKISLFYNPIKKVQLFAKAGSGFHSNYTHAAVEQRDIHPLPKALSAEVGAEFKVGKKLIGTLAFWTIKSDAEYIFVADAGEFENNGSSLRKGIDFAIKYEVLKNTWFNLSTNLSKGVLLDEKEGENSIPAAPRFTSTASVIYNHKSGLDLYVGTRFMAKRPLVEDESIMADEYFLLDASINYTYKKFRFGVSVQNIMNKEWMEAIFYDESRLQGEPTGVEDYHFTPGTPRYFKGSITYSF